MNYKKVLDNAPDTYFLIKDKDNKVIYPKDKRKLDYIRKIYINYSKENKYSTFDNRNFSIKKVTKGNVYVVFGCTGDRDKDKRIKMSRIACENAKYVIMTHDDPHFENQEEIYLDMTKGLKYDNYEIVRDRKEAITKGIDMLKENDTLLILGKGHEEFISIKGDKIPFNDTKIANEYINEIKESVN